MAQSKQFLKELRRKYGLGEFAKSRPASRRKTARPASSRPGSSRLGI